MRKAKPLGWPAYMEPKTVQGGVAYFWNAPSWARKRGCPIRHEALGRDYGEAKRRCDDYLNPLFESWRTGGASDEKATRKLVTGTVDWMFSVYRDSPLFPKSDRTRSSYEYALALVAFYKLKDGRRFGELSLASIQPGNADALYDRLKVGKDGGERRRAPRLAMVICKRAWDVARRSYKQIVPADNPFEKMELGEYEPKANRKATLDELNRFVAAADALGRPSIGTAAMIGFFWLQRGEDTFLRFAWGDYRRTDDPTAVYVWHHKNHRERIRIPLFDQDGTCLWPELMQRIERTPALGPLMLMRETPDPKRKIHLPWRTGGKNPLRHVQGEVRRICEAAGLDREISLTSFRHGGHTDGARSGLTDAQSRSLGGHKSDAAMLIYMEETEDQQQEGARKRLDRRQRQGTKGDKLSE